MKQQGPDGDNNHVTVIRSENCLSQKVPEVILDTLNRHMSMHIVGYNDV